MLDKTPIEDTFRNAFDNFEADVNPKMWTNIEQKISVNGSQGAGNAVNQAAKQVLTGSKFSALTISITSLVIVAFVAISYFILSPDQKTKSELLVPKSAETGKSSVNNEPLKPAATAEIKHENNLSSQKTERTTESDDVKTKENFNAFSEQQTESQTGSDNNKVESQSSKLTDQPDLSQTNNPATPSQDKESIQSTADEKHETVSADNSNTSNELPLEKPSQDDDFDWGVIANSISPNNDGKNDAFVIKTPDLKSVEVTIIDRSGKTLYKWNNLDGSWDGKDLNGKEMPSGFYLYYIFAESNDGKHHSKKGTLYIFR